MVYVLYTSTKRATRELIHGSLVYIVFNHIEKNFVF